MAAGKDPRVPIGQEARCRLTENVGFLDTNDLINSFTNQMSERRAEEKGMDIKEGGSIKSFYS
jgi:hypothetical protein